MKQTTMILGLYYLIAILILILGIFQPIAGIALALVLVLGTIFFNKRFKISLNFLLVDNLVILFPLMMITTINRTDGLGAMIIVSLLIMYGFIFLIVPKHRIKTKTMLLPLFLIGFMYASLLMIIGNVNETTKSHYLSIVFGIIVTFLIVRCVNSIINLKHFYNIWGVALFISIIFGWVEVITDQLIFKSNDYNLNNIATVGFYNPNDYSFLLTVSLPIIFYWINKRKIGKLIGLFMLGSSVYIMYMNETRLSLVVALGMILYYVLKKSITSIKSLILSVVSLLIVIYIARDEILLALEMVNTMFDSNGSSYSVRLLLTKEAFEIFKEHPFGIGPGNIETIMIKPHNFWVEMLVNYGIFMFVGLVLFFAYTLIKLYKNRANMNGIFKPIIWMILIFVVTSNLSSSIFQFNITWVVFGTMVCGINIIKILKSQQQNRIKNLPQ